MYSTTFLGKPYEHESDVPDNPSCFYSSDEQGWEEKQKRRERKERAYNYVERKYPPNTDADISELSKKMMEKSERRIRNGEDIIDRFMDNIKKGNTNKFVLAQCRNKYEAKKLLEYAGGNSKILTHHGISQKITTDVYPGFDGCCSDCSKWRFKRKEKPTLYVLVPRPGYIHS